LVEKHGHVKILLRNWELQPDWVNELATHLKSSRIRSFTIDQCSVGGDIGCWTLSVAFGRMKLLHSVGLIKVEMGNDGLAYLADALPKMRAIRRIDVSRNRVRSEGFHEFSKYLCSSLSQIESFDVSYNRKLGDIAFIRFCESLRAFSSSRLKSTQPEKGSIHDEEREEGSVCVGLKSMEWRECGLSNDMMECLGKLLLAHCGLVDIDLRENEAITFGGIKSLLKILFDTSKTKRKHESKTNTQSCDMIDKEEEVEVEVDEKQLIEEWGRVIRISQFTIDTGSLNEHVENMQYPCRIICSGDRVLSFFIHPPPSYSSSSGSST
jgi:hypothetical protein